jgi:hypothetical protein
MARRRNIYRPGTASYDAFREAELRRRARLAQANIKRAKKPEAIRKTKRRAAAIDRELAKVTAREQARAGLSEADRAKFNRLGVGKQNNVLSAGLQEYPGLRDAVLQVAVRYPDGPPPKSVPDPFAHLGENRNAAWSLYYKSIARNRRARRRREAAPPTAQTSVRSGRGSPEQPHGRTP